MFEQASKLKLRFSCRGSITVEDLWDLSAKDLNEIYIDLAKGKKDTEADSLINSREDKILTLKMDILKHIFDAKREEAAAVKIKAEAKRKKQLILEIIDEKSNEDLKSKSVEELQAMIDSEDDTD